MAGRQPSRSRDADDRRVTTYELTAREKAQAEAAAAQAGQTLSVWVGRALRQALAGVPHA